MAKRNDSSDKEKPLLSIEPPRFNMAKPVAKPPLTRKTTPPLLKKAVNRWKNRKNRSWNPFSPSHFNPYVTTPDEKTPSNNNAKTTENFGKPVDDEKAAKVFLSVKKTEESETEVEDEIDEDPGHMFELFNSLQISANKRNAAIAISKRLKQHPKKDAKNPKSTSDKQDSDLMTTVPLSIIAEKIEAAVNNSFQKMLTSANDKSHIFQLTAKINPESDPSGDTKNDTTSRHQNQTKLCSSCELIWSSTASWYKNFKENPICQICFVKNIANSKKCSNPDCVNLAGKGNCYRNDENNDFCSTCYSSSKKTADERNNHPSIERKQFSKICSSPNCETLETTKWYKNNASKDLRSNCDITWKKKASNNFDRKHIFQLIEKMDPDSKESVNNLNQELPNDPVVPVIDSDDEFTASHATHVFQINAITDSPTKSGAPAAKKQKTHEIGKPPMPIGLVNDSIYQCCLNTAIQFFFSITEFVQILSSWTPGNNRNNAALEMKRLLQTFHNRGNAASTTQLCEALLVPQKDREQPQDLHNLFFYIETTISKFIKDFDVQYIDLRKGRLQTTLTCFNCKTAIENQYTFDKFHFILPCDKVLEELIYEAYLKERSITYHCLACNNKNQSQETTTITEAPKLLTILLLHKVRCDKRKKVIIPRIRFPDYLNLTPMINNSPNKIPSAASLVPFSGTEDGWNTTPLAKHQLEAELNRGEHVYELLCVATHEKEITPGYYKAYVKRENDWFLCDSETVIQCESDYVKEAAEKVCMLQYRKMDTPKISNINNDSFSPFLNDSNMETSTTDSPSQSDRNFTKPKDNIKRQNGNSSASNITTLPQPVALSNTSGIQCFLNAIIQILFSIPEFVETLSNWTPTDHNMASELKELMQRFYNANEDTLLSTEQILPLLYIPDNQRHIQQDLEEYMRVIIDEISVLIGENGNEQPYKEQYNQGTLRTTIFCIHCEKESPTDEKFHILPVAIERANSLEQALINELADSELMTGENSYKCNSCGPANARRYHNLLSSPKILMMNLKRFDADLQKIHNRVTIPNFLDLNYLILYPNETNATRLRLPNADLLGWVDLPSTDNHIQNLLQDGDKIYELIAVANHVGSNIASGHYIAFVKRANQWYCCNDTRIDTVTAEFVKQQSTTNAYFLVYRQVERAENPIETPQRNPSITKPNSTEYSTPQRRPSKRPGINKNKNDFSASYSENIPLIECRKCFNAFTPDEILGHEIQCRVLIDSQKRTNAKPKNINTDNTPKRQKNQSLQDVVILSDDSDTHTSEINTSDNTNVIPLSPTSITYANHHDINNIINIDLGIKDRTPITPSSEVAASDLDLFIKRQLDLRTNETIKMDKQLCDSNIEFHVLNLIETMSKKPNIAFQRPYAINIDDNMILTFINFELGFTESTIFVFPDQYQVHFFTFIYNVADNTLHFINSYNRGNRPNKDIETKIRQKLQKLYNKAPLPTNVINLPQSLTQDESDDIECGVYASLYCELILKGIPLQAIRFVNIRNYKKRMIGCFAKIVETNSYQALGPFIIKLDSTMVSPDIFSFMPDENSVGIPYADLDTMNFADKFENIQTPKNVQNTSINTKSTSKKCANRTSKNQNTLTNDDFDIPTPITNTNSISPYKMPVVTVAPIVPPNSKKTPITKKPKITRTSSTQKSIKNQTPNIVKSDLIVDNDDLLIDDDDTFINDDDLFVDKGELYNSDDEDIEEDIANFELVEPPNTATEDIFTSTTAQTAGVLGSDTDDIKVIKLLIYLNPSLNAIPAFDYIYIHNKEIKYAGFTLNLTQRNQGHEDKYPHRKRYKMIPVIQNIPVGAAADFEPMLVHYLLKFKKCKLENIIGPRGVNTFFTFALFNDKHPSHKRLINGIGLLVNAALTRDAPIKFPSQAPHQKITFNVEQTIQSKINNIHPINKYTKLGAIYVITDKNQKILRVGRTLTPYVRLTRHRLNRAHNEIDMYIILDNLSFGGTIDAELVFIHFLQNILESKLVQDGHDKDEYPNILNGSPSSTYFLDILNNPDTPEYKSLMRDAVKILDTVISPQNRVTSHANDRKYPVPCQDCQNIIHIYRWNCATTIGPICKRCKRKENRYKYKCTYKKEDGTVCGSNNSYDWYNNKGNPICRRCYHYRNRNKYICKYKKEDGTVCGSNNSTAWIRYNGNPICRICNRQKNRNKYKCTYKKEDGSVCGCNNSGDWYNNNGQPICIACYREKNRNKHKCTYKREDGTVCGSNNSYIWYTNNGEPICGNCRNERDRNKHTCINPQCVTPGTLWYLWPLDKTARGKDILYICGKCQKRVKRGTLII